MRKSSAIVLGALAVSAALFAGVFFCTRFACTQHLAKSTDDLDWLRLEFRLSDAELARVRTLHEGYLPKCDENCQLIAAKKRELAQAVAANTNTNTTATLDQLRGEVAALRTKCQSEMLAHFEEVSRAMPTAQGQRYLAEMKRLVLGSHEQLEQSMSGTNQDAHGQH